ncbi:MAG TPA: cytoplasmic protein [Deltaproteobacteria bacterium]|nr:cytoplasmic protein [Deltaproteobacteria bacterium]
MPRETVALRREENIIHLTYEDIAMLKKEITYRNPLMSLGYEKEDILPDGGFGAVMAHAGVGKTALLVQMALNAMLRDESVLHVSLHDAVSKVDVWYKELFQKIAHNIDAAEARDYWEKIQPHRFIMIFKVENFSVPKLEERLAELMEQNIFRPHTVIIDGLIFDETGRGPLAHLKELAGKYSIRIWFTVHAHRHEERASNELPVWFMHIADLFEVVVELVAENDEVFIKTVKGKKADTIQNSLRLDTSTMLVKDSK